MKKTNKRMTIEDQTIAVEIRDRETDYVWVFLHGWGVDKSVWTPVTDKLSATTITIDLPGFGKSSDLAEPKNTEDYSRYIQQLVEKLGHNKIILVGHSFGGQVAVNIAANQPDWLAGLVLVGASAVRSESPPLLSAVGSFFSPLFQVPGVRRLRPLIYRLIGADLPPENEHLKKTMRTILREDQTNKLRDITVPTVVIWGKDDNDQSIQDAQKITQKITKSELIKLPGGHFVFTDSPKSFVSKLRKFNNSLDI